MEHKLPTSGAGEIRQRKSTLIPCLGTSVEPGDVIVVSKFDLKPPFVIRADQVAEILAHMPKPLNPS